MFHPQLSTSAENHSLLTFTHRKLWCSAESGFWCFLFLLLLSCCFFNFFCLHPEMPWPSREWSLLLVNGWPRIYLLKSSYRHKKCCTERHLSKNRFDSLNFLQIIGAFLGRMEICEANSASGSTVPFLPDPEVSLGFTMWLFRTEPGDTGKIWLRNHHQHQATHVFNDLQIHGTTKLRYLLSLPVLPTHTIKTNQSWTEVLNHTRSMWQHCQVALLMLTGQAGQPCQCSQVGFEESSELSCPSPSCKHHPGALCPGGLGQVQVLPFREQFLGIIP